MKLLLLNNGMPFLLQNKKIQIEWKSRFIFQNIFSIHHIDVERHILLPKKQQKRKY